jgi:hypothetical protein
MTIKNITNQKLNRSSFDSTTVTGEGDEFGEEWDCDFELLFEGDCAEVAVKFSKPCDSSASAKMSYSKHKFMVTN